jgi:hypothetical protein
MAPVNPGMTIDIRRACSQMRSRITYPNFVFFEEASNPIMTLTAFVPSSSTNSTPMVDTSTNGGVQLAAFGFPTFAQYHPIQYDQVPLASINLKGVNLMQGPPFAAPFTFNLAALQQAYPTTWSNILIGVQVCDDRNGNGLCDETYPWILSVGEEQFALNHIPSTVTIDVWSGRGYLVANDPEVCDIQYSPLVLDMTRAGFRMTSAENGVYFDLNDTGSAVRTGWTGRNNLAFLVRDINHDGSITSGAELFGTATRLPNGQRATNGFEALQALDSDGDGQFTPNDVAWNDIKLWFDLDHNGISASGEMISLDQAGITSINLNYVGVHETDPYGNQTRMRSTFRMNRGGQSIPSMIIDVWFNTLAALPPVMP